MIQAGARTPPPPPQHTIVPTPNGNEGGLSSADHTPVGTSWLNISTPRDVDTSMSTPGEGEFSAGGGEEASSVATFRDMQSMNASLEQMNRAEYLQKQVDEQLRQRAFGSPTRAGEVTIATPSQVGRDLMNTSTPIGLSSAAMGVVVPPLPMPPPGHSLGDGSRRGTPRQPLPGEPGVKQLADRLSEERAEREREREPGGETDCSVGRE